MIKLLHDSWAFMRLSSLCSSWFENFHNKNFYFNFKINYKMKAQKMHPPFKSFVFWLAWHDTIWLPSTESQIHARHSLDTCLILIFSEPRRLQTNLLSMQALSYITAISQPLHHTCSGLYWDSQNSCFILYTELTQRKRFFFNIRAIKAQFGVS